MARDVDVAQYIYSRTGWIDAWRLQKLTYYSQAWSLAWTGQPLFADRIEAWDDGPVAPELRKAVRYMTSAMSTRGIHGADVTRLPEGGRAVVDAVVLFYGSMSKNELVNRTHGEAPWAHCYIPGRNILITDSAMASFYGALTSRSVDVPVRPGIPDRVVSDDEMLAEAQSQIEGWAETLAILAR